jgi:hypothetical protein
MQPEGHVVTWEEFRTALRAHHIPEGLIAWKLNEFLALTQGTRTVMQYAQAFSHYVSMRVIMQTPMPGSEIVSVVA